MRACLVLSAILFGFPVGQGAAEDQLSELPLRVSWGHQQAEPAPFHLKIVAENLEIGRSTPRDFESTDTLQDGVCRTRAGGGDCDGVDFLTFSVCYNGAENPSNCR